jgi:hypothetical protein
MLHFKKRAKMNFNYLGVKSDCNHLPEKNPSCRSFPAAAPTIRREM